MKTKNSYKYEAIKQHSISIKKFFTIGLMVSLVGEIFALILFLNNIRGLIGVFTALFLLVLFIRVLPNPIATSKKKIYINISDKLECRKSILRPTEFSYKEITIDDKDISMDWKKIVTIKHDKIDQYATIKDIFGRKIIIGKEFRHYYAIWEKIVNEVKNANPHAYIEPWIEKKIEKCRKRNLEDAKYR